MTVMKSLLGLLWIGGGWLCLETFWCSISCTVLLLKVQLSQRGCIIKLLYLPTRELSE